MVRNKILNYCMNTLVQTHNSTIKQVLRYLDFNETEAIQ